MLAQDKFISASELQQNLAKTIDKAKNDDVIIIRNNKLEAAIISIEKYNQLQQYLEWKQLSSALDSLPIESIDDDEAKRIRKILDAEKGQERFDIRDINKVAESEEHYG